LSLLADFQPDKLKLDKSIIQGVQTSGPRQAIVRSVIEFCFCLGITVVAEGVETEAEWQWLQSAGVRRFQGYLFARPGFECVPPVAWSSLLDIDEANHALRQTQMNNLNRINTVV
jgi:EAL domain-containing protein (putative c-di-GMP-specific phosphodiesterase class I)